MMRRREACRGSAKLPPFPGPTPARRHYTPGIGPGKTTRNATFGGYFAVLKNPSAGGTWPILCDKYHLRRPSGCPLYVLSFHERQCAILERGAARWGTDLGMTAMDRIDSVLETYLLALAGFDQCPDSVPQPVKDRSGAEW